MIKLHLFQLLAFVVVSGAYAESDASLLRIPASLEKEHEIIHSALEDLMGRPGEVGAAARRLEEALAPHFHEENETALPVLAVLPQLAAKSRIDGKVREEALVKAERVREHLPRFLEEHKKIRAAAAGLGEASRKNHDAAGEKFVKELGLHAATEEAVLYPAAIVAGEMLGRK